jgi:hypothetical protein
VGTDNARELNQAYRDECGVLLAFRAKDGAFLWQDAAPRVNRGLGDFLLPSTTRRMSKGTVVLRHCRVSAPLSGHAGLP